MPHPIPSAAFPAPGLRIFSTHCDSLVYFHCVLLKYICAESGIESITFFGFSKARSRLLFLFIPKLDIVRVWKDFHGRNAGKEVRFDLTNTDKRPALSRVSPQFLLVCSVETATQPKASHISSGGLRDVWIPSTRQHCLCVFLTGQIRIWRQPACGQILQLMLRLPHKPVWKR